MRKNNEKSSGEYVVLAKTKSNDSGGHYMGRMVSKAGKENDPVAANNNGGISKANYQKAQLTKSSSLGQKRNSGGIVMKDNPLAHEGSLFMETGPVNVNSNKPPDPPDSLHGIGVETDAQGQLHGTASAGMDDGEIGVADTDMLTD